MLGSSLPQACGAQFALLLSPAVYARTRPAGESSDPAAEWLRHTPARLTAALAASAAVLLLAVPLAELRPDGTFTSAALPPHIGTATPETYGQDGSITGAWPARGTWTLSPGGPDGSPPGVTFTVNCGAAPAGCAGHPATFELHLETNAPEGGGGPALFYYLDSSRDLGNQFPFNRQP